MKLFPCFPTVSFFKMGLCAIFICISIFHNADTSTQYLLSVLFSLFHFLIICTWVCLIIVLQSNFNGSNTSGIIRANEYLLLRQVWRHNRDKFSIFFNMKVNCVFSLESPNRGDSNENTQYTIFNLKKKTLNYPKSAAREFFPRDSRTNSKEQW